MIKRRLRWRVASYVSAAILVLLVDVARAQPFGRIHAGVSIPVAPDEFSDLWGTHLAFGFGFGFPVNSKVSVIGMYDYNRFSFDEASTRQQVGSGFIIDEEQDAATAAIYSLSVDLRLAFLDESSRLCPYVIGGVGFSGLDSDEVILSSDDSTFVRSLGPPAKAGLGTRAGAGIDIRVGGTTRVFIEARFAVLSATSFEGSDRVTYVPVVVGVRSR